VARARSATTSARVAPSAASGVAALLEPVLSAAFSGEVPVRFVFWDNSTLGSTESPGAVHVHSPRAIARIIWARGELGLSRAYVVGEIDLEGEIFTVLDRLHHSAPRGPQLSPRQILQAARAARALGALAPPRDVPDEELGRHGRRHSRAADATAVGHHYDVGNDFYRILLGPSMTYSCARFTTPTASLEQAQSAKHDLICAKLGLDARHGARLLDVGCGWGSLALHAAEKYGAQVTGITLSREQAAFARRRVADAGLEDRVEIRLQDYRDLGGERFDAISSVGMFEHVGATMMAVYFERLHGLLGPGGRLVNHAISVAGGSKIKTNTFIGRYVFPDGELIDVGEVVLAMQRAGFEVRDVESLREHYAVTLRHWVANLDASWSTAVGEVGEHRARIWRLYLAGSANGFANGHLAIHQVLGVVTGEDGNAMMPAVRTW
jgi:cyclopropane-fatty-acyl-phospholipid synthase